jgi:hypothetical protein
MLKPQGLYVDKTGYVSVGHLLPWISPKYVVIKYGVYSIFLNVITKSTNIYPIWEYMGDSGLYPGLG